MVNVIKTPRLELKPFSGSDRTGLAALLVNEAIKETFMIPDFADPESLEKMVTVFLERSCSEAHFIRGIYSDGALIGFVNDVEIDQGCIELGYVIHPIHWGKGFATEMLHAVIPVLLGKGYFGVKTGAFCENIASIRVMEKCGMQKCPYQERIEYRGNVHTCVYYEIRG